MNKTILIIAPYSKFKLYNSKNRICFLNYMSQKNNIILYDDCTQNSFELFMLNIIKQKIYIDCILYYLIYHDKKLLISVDAYLLKNIPVKNKICFIEDFYFIDIYHKFIKYMNFDMILLPLKNDKIQKIYKQYFNIPIKVWGFFFDTKLFKPIDIKKEYEILFYGSSDEKYFPLANRIYNILSILQNYLKDKIKIIPYQYSFDENKYENLPLFINKAKYVVATSGIFDLFSKKYQEILLCGSKIIGNIPDGYQDILKGNIYELKKNDDDKILVNKILKCIKIKKYKKNKKIINFLKKKYSLDNAYNILDKYTESFAYN